MSRKAISSEYDFCLVLREGEDGVSLYNYIFFKISYGGRTSDGTIGNSSELMRNKVFLR